MCLNLEEKIRTWVAHKLDSKYSDICWVKIYLWSVPPYDKSNQFRDVFGMRHTAGECAKRSEYNYCGKCDIKANSPVNQ